MNTQVSLNGKIVSIANIDFIPNDSGDFQLLVGGYFHDPMGLTMSIPVL